MRIRREIEIQVGTNKLTDKQVKWLQEAVNFVQFLSSHPQFIPSYAGLDVSQYVWTTVDSEYATKADGSVDYDSVMNKVEQDADVKAQMATFARALAPCEKNYTDDTFRLERKFGKHTVSVIAERQAVCRRVVTGVEAVEEVDYERAPKRVVEREVVEWVCDEPLLGGASTKGA